jgi:hypothetical protein
VLHEIADVETLEVLACIEGLPLAKDLLITGDCLLQCDQMFEGSSMGHYGHIVQEIKAINKSFQIADLVHESRSANGDAHSLVEKGASIRHICLEPNSIHDQWVHQSRFI